MQRFIQQWIRISLISLATVALLGCILRYKIAFSLPFVDQKYLLHAHSHFAFSGWITQALMTCLTGYLAKSPQAKIQKKYNVLLLANLITACGMLFSFPWEGYGIVSIIFSTLSIFVSYFFAVIYWHDLNKLPQKCIEHTWFKFAIVFNAVSSIGAFSLAFMMATKIMHPELYTAAIYFFLHFQYNGWFFFACMGLFTAYLSTQNINLKYMPFVLQLFAAAIVPVYFLSILWVEPSLWIYIIIVLSVTAQFVAFLLMVFMLRPYLKKIISQSPSIAVWLTAFATISLFIKLLLQMLSVIPSLNQMVYGFRPIVIGYLHLVFLGIITLFLLGYCILHNYIITSKAAIKGIYIFTAGIIINEVLLMLQGVYDLFYINIPYMSEMLLAAAIIMFTGVTFTVISQYKRIEYLDTSSALFTY
ncbi:hypothetical protein FW778_15455 [Ginsengibacter hankyongi]|uniref:Uncharacterized protein n=1 Tax=Ginsengibacter hankyongi TaxID=2607284 RepID=A0A5J5IEB5_9BACT|nr:hypothetical protein [Ginsengibacter hankyongi]KAA9038147.1 hypothetical protein FW778_15455 [Ginsengibacter hankyongi]